MIPLGTMVQAAAEPIVLRWGMAAFVFVFVAILASGWRYHWKPNVFAGMGAGALSGFAGGTAQMSGPPIILYWLGSPSGAQVVRANLMVFLFLVATTLVVNYTWHGFMTKERLALAEILWDSVEPKDEVKSGLCTWQNGRAAPRFGGATPAETPYVGENQLTAAMPPCGRGSLCMAQGVAALFQPGLPST